MATDQDSQPGKFRRVYGRGVFDGLAMAGIDNPRDYMNTNKLLAAERGLNGMAQKVLSVVPIAEAWTPSQICGELKRTGMNPDMRIVTGCLDSLKGYGLVKEQIAGQFQRVKITVRTVHRPAAEVDEHVVEPSCEQAETTAQKQAEKPADTMDKIGAIAAGLRALAKQANKLADDIDAAAIEVEERFEQEQANSAGLRKLQAVLRESLGV